jgi:aminoglycoside phosphotransferase (APT) family kinase protein
MYNLVTKEIINKGWSGDKKYCVTTDKGENFLLRVSPIEQYEKKKTEFELMGKVASLGVPMCKPLEFGRCDEGVYSIQTFIDGVDAEEIAPTLTSDKQYHFGFEAGKILKEIHKLPAPENVPDWEIRFNQKIDRKIKMYSECPFKYENGQAFLDYISTHRHLLANRPQTYQHGDYHIGNMMIGNDGNLYIIDFNRNDYGDPWEEFNRIVWCAQTAPLFATGMVNGYFGNNVPKEFWELLALYISSNTLSSLPWAIPFGEEQMQVMINQANDVLNWYDNMKNPIPTWYKGTI